MSKAHRQMETRPVRHEISSARLRAIESTIHKGVREPLLETHPKSEEDVVYILCLIFSNLFHASNIYKNV